MKSIKVVSVCSVLIGVVSWTNPAHANGFPGDGYANPDAFGVSGHGPALSYKDNGDGTFTDKNTKFMWEKKLAADGSDGGNCQDGNQANRSVHCVNNFYTWTDTTDGDNTDPDGTLFTNFLDTLNNKCSDETTTCTLDRDCSGIGNGKCGFAGHRDWCIPNIKKLQSIVDYSTSLPASSVPGATAASGFGYWSATTIAGFPGFAWFVGFNNGDVNGNNKDNGFPARAVRPCE